MPFGQQINARVEFMTGRLRSHVKVSDMPSDRQSTGSEFRTMRLSTFPEA